MKKLTFLTFALMLSLLLVGCGSSSGNMLSDAESMGESIASDTESNTDRITSDVESSLSDMLQ